MRGLNGKVAIVTGGAGRIGKAVTARLVDEGVRVAVADINADAAGAVAAEHGDKALAITFDAGDEKSIEAMVATTVARFGRLDILHNNAAYVPLDLLEADVDILTIPTSMWDVMMEGTLRGTMLGCRYGVIEMLKTGGGSIINTSSMYGVGAFNRQPAYGVAKAAINMLTEYVATAWGKQNIRCNAVAPSMVKTPLLESFVPAELLQLNVDAALTQTLPEPEDIAAIVAFLASDDARFLTGQVIRADGGTTAHLSTYSDAARFFAAA